MDNLRRITYLNERLCKWQRGAIIGCLLLLVLLYFIWEVRYQVGKQNANEELYNAGWDNCNLSTQYKLEQGINDRHDFHIQGIKGIWFSPLKNQPKRVKYYTKQGRR